MIHTALDFIYDNIYGLNVSKDQKVATVLVEHIKKAINEARIEAINECANKFDEQGQYTNKESILKILDQIK